MLTPAWLDGLSLGDAVTAVPLEGGLDGCGQIPPAFYAAYEELHPLDPGWQARLPILHLREHLCVLAHFGPVPETLQKIHTTLSAH